MAFTPAEEDRLRALLQQDTSLITLAQNEPAIIQELGDQDVTIQDLQLANTTLDTDKLIGRLGGEDKAILLSVLKSFMNNGMATSVDLAALLPKRVFQQNDFIRIPDAPGGLIIQWAKGAKMATGDSIQAINLPTQFPTENVISIASTMAITQIYSDQVVQVMSWTRSSVSVVDQWAGVGTISGGVYPLVIAIGY